MARGPGSAGGVASCPPRDMPSVSTHRWTCPSQPSKPTGHVPRRGPAPDMSLAGLKSRWACPTARTSIGHVPWRAQIPQGMSRGTALDMSLGGLKSRGMSRGAGQGWAYWRYVHCPGPTLGISRIGTEVSAHAREGTSRGVRESCGTCHCGHRTFRRSPRHSRRDMSLGGLTARASHGQRTCPSARARDGHIGIMSIAGTNTGHIPHRDRGLCARPKGTSRGVRESGHMSGPRASTGHVPWRARNPAGHVPRRGPGMGILALCPLLGSNAGHVPRRERGLCAHPGRHVPRSS